MRVCILSARALGMIRKIAGQPDGECMCSYSCVVQVFRLNSNKGITLTQALSRSTNCFFVFPSIRTIYSWHVGNKMMDFNEAESFFLVLSFTLSNLTFQNSAHFSLSQCLPPLSPSFHLSPFASILFHHLLCPGQSYSLDVTAEGESNFRGT